MNRVTFIFLFTLALVSTAAANEIIIESEGGQQYLTFSGSDSQKIAGYNIQLNYSAATEILSVELSEPYTGVSKIANGAGWTRIIGFTGGDAYSARLAEFTYAGVGNFSIVVYELYDSDLNDVAVSNTFGTMLDATGTPTPTIPEYRPNTGYVSPTGTTSGSRPITGESASLPVVPDLTSVSSPEPTLSVASSPSTALAEVGTPTVTLSPAMARQNVHCETTPKSPFNTVLVIYAIIIVGICFANIRKHI